MKNTILAALLAAFSVPVLASSYYVVVPVPSRTATTGNILVSLNTYSLPLAVAGRPYAGFDFNSLLQVKGDPAFNAAGVTWSVEGGVLPAGLALRADGRLTGTPTAGGTSSFQVRASYKTKSGAQAYQVLVGEVTVALASAALPAGVQGSAYFYDVKQLLSITGDPQFSTRDITWTFRGTFPAGLQLNTDGTITGVPAAGGTSSFEVLASYLGKSGARAYEIVVGDITISLAAAAPPAGVVGQAYPGFDLKPSLTVSGDAAYQGGGAGATWTVAGGALPPGLVLNAGTGVIAGTPTARGTGPATVRASYKNAAATHDYSIALADALTQYSGYRAWSDGSLAASCKEYRNPAGNYRYLGATGNGVYRIKPGAAAVDVYCDMTTDGGGWTLVLQSDFKGMLPEVMGTGTSRVCTQLNDSCFTSGASAFYRGTPVQATIRDYMFLQSPKGAAGLYEDVILLHSAANYVRGPIAAPGTALFELMTDSTQGWAHPNNHDADPSDHNVSKFPGTEGNTWSDGNWHGCTGDNPACGGYTYQAGAQAQSPTSNWGNHMFTNAPTYDAAKGVYYLAPWTYWNVANDQDFGSTRTISKSVFEAWRWAAFVR